MDWLSIILCTFLGMMVVSTVAAALLLDRTDIYIPALLPIAIVGYLAYAHIASADVRSVVDKFRVYEALTDKNSISSNGSSIGSYTDNATAIYITTSSGEPIAVTEWSIIAGGSVWKQDGPWQIELETMLDEAITNEIKKFPKNIKEKLLEELLEADNLNDAKLILLKWSNLNGR